MTLADVREVLATIAAFDGRHVDRRTLEEWQPIIGGMPLDLARQAVREWYAENRGYAQPRDVVEYAARITGLDRAESVTDRRIAGRPNPWDGEPLAEPLALPEPKPREVTP